MHAFVLNVISLSVLFVLLLVITSQYRVAAFFKFVEPKILLIVFYNKKESVYFIRVILSGIVKIVYD